MGSIQFRIWCVAVALTSFIIAGCPDNGATTGASGGATVTGGTSSGTGRSATPGGSVGGDQSGTGFITINKVVRSNQDPNSLIELVGTNGDIGNNCADVNACKCVFSWLETGGVIRSAEMGLARVETDLVRCSFTIVSPDAKYFDVMLKIVAAGLTSNSTRVFMPTSNPSLDASIAANYLPVQRFMCRDMIPFQSNTQKYKGLFDPALWNYSYAYNFYTSSLGQDYGATALLTAGGSVVEPKGFECPPIPNDPSDNPIYDYKITSFAPVNLAQPSAINVGSGDTTIYPVDDDIGQANCPTGVEPGCEKFILNRHDFYVATFKSGIFKQPVCITHRVTNKMSGATIDCTGTQDTATSGPITLSSPSLAGKDVIGFAAMPDQNQRCPDPNLLKIPAGKKWAKVWKFRSTLPARSLKDVNNAGDIGTLFCTNREDECFSNKAGPINGPGEQIVNTVCYNAKKGTAGNGANTALGFAQSAQIGTALTDPGYGNCDLNGTWGDGNGDRPDGLYSACMDMTTSAGAGCARFGAAPGVFDPVAGKYTAGSCTPATGSSAGYNCCTDLGDNDPQPQLAATNKPVHMPANYTPGGQICTPTLIGKHDASSQLIFDHVPVGGVANQGVGQDVWLMGSGNKKACIEADTDPNGRILDFNLPSDGTNPYLMSSRQFDASSLSDELYVVTPERINMEDMMNKNSPIAQQYWPIRGPAPFAITVGSQNSANPADRLSQFPLCILQDSVQGQLQGNAP